MKNDRSCPPYPQHSEVLPLAAVEDDTKPAHRILEFQVQYTPMMAIVNTNAAVEGSLGASLRGRT
jgi:hypothetical protein